MLDSGHLLNRAYVFICIFVFMSVFYSATNPVTAIENSQTQLPIIQKLEHIKNRTGVGAISYAMVEGNAIIAMGGFGEYGLENKRRVTETSLFRVGSITKTFTSLAVMLLVEQGKIQLNQSVNSFVSGFPLNNPWPETPVTIEMLLEHTAGLQDLTREEFDYPHPLSLEAALNLKPETRRVHWQPGYHYSYSNQGAGYIGRVIELVTKENYDDWFEHEILHRLDMRESQLRWSKNLHQDLVTGYDADLKTTIPYWHTLFRPFGGLNTSASDMAKFLMLFTKQSTTKNIISEVSLKRMETPVTSLAAKAGLKTGYGLGIRSRYVNGRKVYGHSGDGDGYLAEFIYSNESNRAYFVVINAYRHDILNEFTDLLNKWLIESVQKNNIQNKNKRDPQDKTRGPLYPPIMSQSREKNLALTGEYREITQRFPFTDNKQEEKLHIKYTDKGLFRCFSHLKKCTEILPITQELFRTEQAPYASMAFVQALDGELYLQTSFGNYQKE